MQIRLTPPNPPGMSLDVWSDGQAVAIVPHPRGQSAPVPPVWYSADGRSFTAGVLDTRALAVPVYGDLEGRGLSRVPAGRFFHTSADGFVEGRLGPSVALHRLAFEPPLRFKIRLKAMAAHPDGTLWLGGHHNADSAKGIALFSRDEGHTWVTVDSRIPGSVEAFLPVGAELFALADRSVVRIGAAGVEEIAKYKDTVRDVWIDERGIFGFGETFTAYGEPGKKQKYGKLLADTDRGTPIRVAAGADGFVLGRHDRVYTSKDALAWMPVPGWNDSAAGEKARYVRAVVPSATGVLVVTTEGEVLAAP